ncbi:MAG: hypothetical protein NC299_01610 [Lachnospiraceae bacterium]|nr:hypothetical protein [Ruminococcus sp.]MCM1274046.1 hypothetical protein [Lachnospiraceae bacterium]
MKISKEDFACRLTDIFPEKTNALKRHYGDYGELLGHIFFADEVSLPLFELLLESDSGGEISKYCGFIEEMWQNGADDVVNIVDVTIAERLSDDDIVWERFGKNISDDFITYINEELLAANKMISNAKRLEFNGGRYKGKNER